MKTAISAFLVLAAAAVANAQLTINTPLNPVECLPQLITWSGGTPPYFVTVEPGGQPGATPLVDFGEQNGTQLTWEVNIAAGTSCGLSIRDNTGATQNSAPFTIQSGSDTSCVSSSASFSAGSATAPASTTGGSSATTTGGSSSSTGGSTSKATTSGSATSGGSAASSTSAAMPFAQIGSAGILGAIAVALFA